MAVTLAAAIAPVPAPATLAAAAAATVASLEPDYGCGMVVDGLAGCLNSNIMMVILPTELTG